MKNRSKKLLSLLSMLLIASSFSLTAFAADGIPSDVESLSGVAGDSQVILSWSAATDDVGIAGYQVHYGLTPVDAPGETYDSVEDVGNVLEYTLTGLDNDVPYYFSVIAYDADANESLAWARELVVTPSADGADVDSDAPQVMEASAMNNEEVRVVFSEAIMLPEMDADTEFFIENQENFEPLTVLEAIMNEDDATKMSVILLTEKQEAGVEYKLTVNLGVSDLSGNVIVSGTSDTAIFEGSDMDKPSEDSKAPKLLSVEALDENHITLEFDESVVLGIDPSENFSIVAENDASVELEITGVELGTTSAGIENASVLITTSMQDDISYMLIVTGLEDMAGNVVSSSASSMTFTGIAGEAIDNPDDNMDDTTDDVIDTPSEAVANFLAKKVFDTDSYFVTLSWTILEDAKDMIKEQKLYMSKNKGDNYNLKATLEADVDKYEVGNLSAGEYWFKLTHLDADGNESDGVVTSITLSETGPGLVGLTLVSLGLGTMFRKKEDKI